MLLELVGVVQPLEDIPKPVGILVKLWFPSRWTHHSGQYQRCNLRKDKIMKSCACLKNHCRGGQIDLQRPVKKTPLCLKQAKRHFDAKAKPWKKEIKCILSCILALRPVNGASTTFETWCAALPTKYFPIANAIFACGLMFARSNLVTCFSWSNDTKESETAISHYHKWPAFRRWAI